MADRSAETDFAIVLHLSDYCVYLLDENRQVTFSQDIEAANDEEAVLKARQMAVQSSRCEVWHRYRLVAKIDQSEQSFQ